MLLHEFNGFGTISKTVGCWERVKDRRNITVISVFVLSLVVFSLLKLDADLDLRGRSRLRWQAGLSALHYSCS